MVNYTNEEKMQNIAELQAYLKGIAYTNPNIPMVDIDGIFGEETRNSVRAFQREYGLPVTGSVDLRTWEEIIYRYDILTKYSTAPQSINAFPKTADFVIILGDEGYLVQLIQLMLSTLGHIFANMDEIEITGKFSKSTENSVAGFQQMSGLDITGEVDRSTWDELVKVLNSIERGGIAIKQKALR